MMRHLSLFTGIGGIDLAFERAGMVTVGQVENDKHAVSVLERHWPDVPRWEDIHDFTGEPGVDVLSGGFPCTDYSVAGRRAGLAGDRGALWWEFHRVAAECRPTWIVGENVPGLLSSNGGRDFGTIIDSLVQLGYGVCYAVLDSLYFGVAQRRRRLFIVGHSGGVPRPEVLALSEGLFGYPPPRREARQGVAGTLENRARGGGLPGTDAATSGFVVPATAYALTAREHKGVSERESATTLVADPAVRRLTPVECARLQGFPDDWNDHLSDTQRYRQYGNAVTVNVAEWIGRQILEGGTP